jgi:hypothetical protein
MKRIFILSIFVFISSSLFAGVAYVSSTNGANVRSAPSRNSDLIQTLSFGSKVEIVEVTNSVEIVNSGNQKIKSRWVKIYFNQYIDINYNESLDRFDTSRTYDEGYVLEALLHMSILKVPPHSIYYYYNLALYDNSDYGNITISYDEITDRFERQQKGMAPYDEYYEPNRSDYTIIKYGNNAEEIEYNDRSEHTVDTLKKYIGLELVDIKDYQNKKMKNPYEVNAKEIERVLTTRPDPYYSFSIPINKGKDSIIIKSDRYDDADHYHFTYAGQILFINKYIIRGDYEEPIHELYDMTTGEIMKTHTFTEGMPYISPDGKYVVDFYATYGWQDNDACALTISTLDKGLHAKKKIRVEFKSWLPVEETNSAFWISNRELIIKVYAVMNVIKGRYDQKNNLTASPEKYQYIKLTIR